MDLSKVKDLKKLLTLGMIAEFCEVMHRPAYKDGRTCDVPPERAMFRVLMKTFASKYATRLDGEWVHPSYIYKLSVLKFALGLLTYKPPKSAERTFSTNQLNDNLDLFIAVNHPELSSALTREKRRYKEQEEGSEGWFSWKGPDIEIVDRNLAFVAWSEEEKKERREWSKLPIY